MMIERFVYAGLSILIILVLLISLTKILQSGFKTSSRFISLYQGGEQIANTERRYGSNTYLLSLLFLILHVLGFFVATMFVLQSKDILNITTLFFVLIIIYITIIVKKVQGEIVK